MSVIKNKFYLFLACVEGEEKKLHENWRKILYFEITQNLNL